MASPEDLLSFDGPDGLDSTADLLCHYFRVNSDKKDFLISLNDVMLNTLPPVHPLLQILGPRGNRQLHKPMDIGRLLQDLGVRGHRYSNDATPSGATSQDEQGREGWGLEELELFESSQANPTTEQLEATEVIHSFARRHLRERRAAGMARLVATKVYLRRSTAGEAVFRAMCRLSSGCPAILSKSMDVDAASEEWNRRYQDARRHCLEQRAESLLAEFTAVVEARLPYFPSSVGEEASGSKGGPAPVPTEETLQVARGLLAGSRELRDGLLWSMGKELDPA